MKPHVEEQLLHKKKSAQVNVLLSLLMSCLLCLPKDMEKTVTLLLSNCLVQRKSKPTKQKPSHRHSKSKKILTGLQHSCSMQFRVGKKRNYFTKPPPP